MGTLHAEALGFSNAELLARTDAKSQFTSGFDLTPWN
jgi:hypothetical protein